MTHIFFMLGLTRPLIIKVLSQSRIRTHSLKIICCVAKSLPLNHSHDPNHNSKFFGHKGTDAVPIILHKIGTRSDHLSSKSWLTDRVLTSVHWGSPGLVKMGGDSCCEGHGFESQHWMLDGHFFTYICCKNCNVCFKRRK